jgi:hypothetical protein
MSNYNIVNNFLPDYEFQFMKSVILGDNFPWYYNSVVVSTQLNDSFQFTHLLYKPELTTQSSYFEVITPLIRVLNAKYILRAKLNLGTRTVENEQGGWHTDHNLSNDFPTARTAVFYLNANNGYTLFKDGTKIESFENRFASFDSQTEHTGVSQTDTQVRCVLNLNYIPNEIK